MDFQYTEKGFSSDEAKKLVWDAPEELDTIEELAVQLTPPDGGYLSDFENLLN